MSLLQIGEQTKYGKVAAVLWIGERYYTMVGRDGTANLVPAILVETYKDDPCKCVQAVHP